jgi:hypothetical protein
MRRGRADLIQDIDRIRHAFRSFKRAAQTLLRAPDHWGRHPRFPPASPRFAAPQAGARGYRR